MTELLHPAPPLADEVVRLRPWRKSDLPSMLVSYQDPVVQRFAWPFTTPYTEQDACTFFVEQEEWRRRGEELSFALVDPAGEEAVFGGGSLNKVDLDKGLAAVGYWLGPAARGRGVATHMVRLVAGWAFGQLGVARLELTCGPDNAASQRVAERCGFSREGVLRSHLPFKGGRRDTVVFSLLPGELR